jgi:hypothetical protein
VTQSETLKTSGAVELALGQRQLAAIGFLVCLVLGCVATVAYLAGRVTSPAAATRAGAPEPQPRAAVLPATAKPAASSHVEQLIVVEPVAQPLPATAVLPAEKAKVPELKPVAEALLAGNTFWQVAATDRGMAEVTCEVLTRKGLPALLSDGPSPGIFRVLVGPIKTTDETNRYKAVLDEAQFHPFIKKY